MDSLETRIYRIDTREREVGVLVKYAVMRSAENFRALSLGDIDYLTSLGRREKRRC